MRGPAKTLYTLTAIWLALAKPAGADEVFDWNTVAILAAGAGGQNSAVLSRTLAMVHLAIHDALNAVDRRYEAYLYEGPAESDATPGVAVAAAARDVLIGVIPQFGKTSQQEKAFAIVVAAYAAAVGDVPHGEPKVRGIAAGKIAAAAMLAARRNDGALGGADYPPGGSPGHGRPHPNHLPANPPISDPALAPTVVRQWGRVTPFTMAVPWQFRLPGPPALGSEQYARDYNEVKRLGGKISAERTAVQSGIARYWYESPPEGWNRIARAVATERRLGRWENARLLALVNAVIADGYIAGADTGDQYNFRRPVTAIRSADRDGNDATPGDPAWDSFMNTPPLPDYPSTHGVAGAASAAVLARFFGTDQVIFSMTSGPPGAGITRSFTSFSQASEESADAGVFAGIHFRTSCEAGIKQGEQIGRRAFAQNLVRYRRDPDAACRVTMGQPCEDRKAAGSAK
jgi:hypothetical protein